MKAVTSEPQTVTKHLWYYEEPRGLLMVYEIRDATGGYIRSDQILIPWRKVLASVKRFQSTRTTGRSRR